MWALYLRNLKLHPIRTKIVTSTVLFSCSDIIAQRIQSTDSQTPIDLHRTSRAAVYGGPLYAPVLHYWFRFMEQIVSFPHSPNLQAALRVLIHTGIYAPTVAIAGFIGFMALTDSSKNVDRESDGINWKHRLAISIEKVKSKTIPLWIDGIAFWIPIMFASYRFFALEHRVVVVNSANLLWTTYLSLEAVGGETNS